MHFRSPPDFPAFFSRRRVWVASAALCSPPLVDLPGTEGLAAEAMACWCLVRAQRFESVVLLFPSLYPCLGSIVQAEAVIDIAYPACFYPHCYPLYPVGYP